MCNNNDDYGDDDNDHNAKGNSTEHKSDLLMEIVCNSDRDTAS